MYESGATYDIGPFNELATIELADAQMRKDDALARAIPILAPVFQQHDMCDWWGIGILHRHYDLGPNEIPIQLGITDEDGRPALVTAPRSGDLAAKPSVWMVKCAKWIALEYSADARAAAAHEVLASNPRFLEVLAQALVSANLQAIFGLVVVREPSKDAALIEYNYGAGRVSILKEMPIATLSGSHFIETAWRFHPHQTNATCEANCYSRCYLFQGKHTPDHRAKHERNEWGLP